MRAAPTDYTAALRARGELGESREAERVARDEARADVATASALLRSMEMSAALTQAERERGDLS